MKLKQSTRQSAVLPSRKKVKDRNYCRWAKKKQFYFFFNTDLRIISTVGKHHGKLKITLRLEAKMNMASAYKRMHQMWHDWKVPLAMM